MAEVRLRTGVDPDAPEEPVVVVAVDPLGPPGDRAVVRLGETCHEGDGVWYLARADGWAERRLDGTRLTVDVVCHRSVLARLEVELDDFDERSEVDPEAVRLLRLSTEVDPAEYARAPVATVVVAASGGGTVDEAVRVIVSGLEWPTVYGPPPT